jgi:hypothetical protein
MPRGCETNPREKENPETLFLYPSDDEEGEEEEEAEVLQTTGGVLRKEPNTVEAAAEHVCIGTAMVAMPEAPPESALFTKSPPLSEGFGLCTNYPNNNRLNPQSIQCGNLSVFFFLKINFISHCGEVCTKGLYL